MSDPTKDIELLAHVVHNIENACGQQKRHTGLSSLSNAVKQRHADVLDSLAHILVAKERNQVFAVGALLAANQNPPLQIVIAENGSAPPEAKLHLEKIFVQLQNIHDCSLRDGRECSRLAPTFIPVPENEYERALVQLETDILTYSWAKIGYRFSKNGRNQNVIETIREIYGTPVNEREDFNKEDQDHLGRLQSAAFVRDHAILRNLETQVMLLGALLSSSLEPEHTFEARLLLYGLYTSKEALESHLDFVRSWDLYIERNHHVFPRRAPYLTSVSGYLEKEAPSTGNTSSIEKTRSAIKSKAPNTLRWLSKVVSIFEHYLRIADIATSASLSALLLGGPIKISTVKNSSATSEVFSLDSITLRQILVAAKCDMPDKSVDEFVQIGASGEKERETTRTVHCECQLLAHIRAQPAIPYIGLSKLPCTFCAIYFEAYRAATNTPIYTRGSHGKTGDWKCPTLPDTEREAELRPALRAKLLELISTGWTSYRRGSRDSQSTDASDEQTRDRSKSECGLRL
ncbi:hypothetical protein C8R47DRAFT_652289 [Mycena vitilis]|nr:hypothetical protein C8R47DRAFT_652289 [Mycena vitilis]